MLVLVSAVPAAAFDCDAAGLRPVTGAMGYAGRSSDSRCEGFFESPVSGAGLELVSATIGVIDWDAGRADRLIVSAPDVSLPGAGELSLRAVGLPPRLYYRMDATIPTGATLTWPVSDVLAPSGITPADLGVYAWVDGADGRVFVPVRVAASAAPPAATGPVVLRLRSYATLDRVVWREVAADGSSSEWRSVTERPHHGGESLSFELPAGAAGPVVLEFRARRAGTDDWLALLVTLWRPAE
jgi:hypothetical protein